ncbi:MAG TPA: type II toxin-antitoxin system HicA family toxin [Spirochaetes bacterium]|nr:type II toxin-antitoxin system HicA family toxin [Spirochaetota bacterium]
MSKLISVSWKELVKRLKEMGFEDSYYSGKHPFMVKSDLTLTIPNPHRKKIGVPLLSRILKQAGISRDEWIGK